MPINEIVTVTGYAPYEANSYKLNLERNAFNQGYNYQGIYGETTSIRQNQTLNQVLGIKTVNEYFSSDRSFWGQVKTFFAKVWGAIKAVGNWIYENIIKNLGITAIPGGWVASLGAFRYQHTNDEPDNQATQQVSQISGLIPILFMVAIAFGIFLLVK